MFETMGFLLLKHDMASKKKLLTSLPARIPQFCHFHLLQCMRAVSVGENMRLTFQFQMFFLCVCVINTVSVNNVFGQDTTAR